MTDRDLGKTMAALVGLDVTLMLVYLIEMLLGSPSWTLHQLVNLDAEATIAAWYTSAKLLLAGVLFLLLAAARHIPSGGAARPNIVRATQLMGVASESAIWRRDMVSPRHIDADAMLGSRAESGNDSLRSANGTEDERVAHVEARHFLLLVGLAFLFLSLDETASLHEQMTLTLRQFQALPRFTGAHGMWIPFLMIGLIGFLAMTWSSWRRLWQTERHGAVQMATGLVLGLLGAVGLEVVSYEVIRPANASTLYVLEVALEEGLEMLGASMLLMGSLRVYRTSRVLPLVQDGAS